MPTYDYKCEECGVRFERFQHFSDDPIDCCPECSGKVHRVIHPVGIVFKGKGFYVTDNRANNSAGTPKVSEDATTGDSMSSTETTTETKAPQAEVKSAPKDDD